MVRLAALSARAVISILVYLAGVASAGGVTNGEPESPGGDTAKRLCLMRTTSPPVIDGVLGDAEWASATRINDLHQFLPVDHGMPTEKSEFFLSYDDDFFYVAARLYDDDPDAISARQLVQGQTLRFDDAIEFLLDPFASRRTGFWFQTNPNGIRREGLYESPIEINRDWDGIWRTEARIDASGWTAEIAVPFKTLNFSPDISTWGFTIARTIARKKEEIAWASFDRAINPGAAGSLECITGLQQGLGLDIVPSGVARTRKVFADGTTRDEVVPSLDVYYKMTPSLTAALTLNTDFSATEVDDRRVNLTRFSLFFPEKRQFFNQDSDIFSFGGLEENGRPFFSRRIGLSDTGEPVDLIAGAKLTGRIGRWNIGFLEVQQDEYADVDKSNIFVGRVYANVLDESSIGFIVTSGNPTANLDNDLVGADFRYRNTRLMAGKTVQGALWYQQSNTEGVATDEQAYGWRLEFPNSEQWFGELNQWLIEENFNPAAGFVNRAGIMGRKAEAGYTFTPNGRLLRDVGFKTIFENIDNVDGELETREWIVKPLVVETQFGDKFELRFKRIREVLDEEFPIHPGFVIGIGDYEFSRTQIVFESALERRLALNLDLDWGDFFDGELTRVGAGIDWRPGKHLFFQLGYEFNDVELPQGSFITRLYRARADVAFNARWSWLNVLQYDNVTETAGFNSRLRFNPQAGQDMFLVLNRQFDVDPLSRDVSSSTSEIVLKFRYTFRF
jgi:hypothetical protein